MHRRRRSSKSKQSLLQKLQFWRHIKLTFVYNLVTRIPKRIRFVISSGVMTVLLLLTTFFGFQYVWLFLPVLVIMAYLMTYFAIVEGIDRAEWIVLFLMPVLYTGFIYAFYFLFPVRWLTRMPLIVMYGFSFYAILLTTNIFNVGVEKNIQLYRAAFSVNFLFQTFVMFLAVQVLLSFRQIYLLNAVGAVAITFPLAIQLLWSVKLKEVLSRNVVVYAGVLALIMGQVALFLSFLPLRSTIFSLFMTAAYYSLSGLLYHYLDEKLFRQTIREYSFVMIFVTIIVLLTIQW